MGKQRECVKCENALYWAIPHAKYIKEKAAVLDLCKNTVCCGITMQTKSVKNVQQCKHFKQTDESRRNSYLKEVEKREKEAKRLEENAMSERTIITTIEVTKILKDIPECFEADKEQIKQDAAAKVKAALCADDVVVTNVQDFVR